MAGRLRAGAAVAVVASLAFACTSGSGTPSPSAESLAPSGSAEPTTSPTAEPTLPPIERAGWTWQVVSDAGPEVSVLAVREIRGRLYALGANYPQPAIWYSDDGVTWTSAYLPPPPPELGFVVSDMVDAGDRLVAIAGGSPAAGPGPVANAIYVSDDGTAWEEVTATPGRHAAFLQQLSVVDDRILAAGHGVWASDDGGLSWTQAVTASALGGTVLSIARTDGLIVAGGKSGAGDTIQGPALVWLSRDAGLTWTRTELSEGFTVSDVAILASGRIVLNGDSVAWYSEDRGATWLSAVAPGLMAWASTPGSIVACSMEGERLVCHASGDGITWTDLHVDLVGESMWVTDVTWQPRFGLTLAGASPVIALGPNPLR